MGSQDRLRVLARTASSMVELPTSLVGPRSAAGSSIHFMPATGAGYGCNTGKRGTWYFSAPSMSRRPLRPPCDEPLFDAAHDDLLSTRRDCAPASSGALPMNDTAPSLATATPTKPAATGLLAGQLAQIGAATGVPFRIVWADGSAYWNSDAPPAFTLTFRTLGAEARVLRYGHVGVLEAYFDGGIDLEGNLAAAFHAGLAAGFDARPNQLVTARNRCAE